MTSAKSVLASNYKNAIYSIFYIKTVHIICTNTVTNFLTKCIKHKCTTFHSQLESCTVMGTAITPRIFPMNLVVIPRGWSNLLRGYHGSQRLNSGVWAMNLKIAHMDHGKDGKASHSSGRNWDKLLQVGLVSQQPDVLGQRDRSSQLAGLM